MARDFREDQDSRQTSLVALATARLKAGLSPPRELYLVQHRDSIPWSQFPVWARPSDPDLFDGCCHEG